MAILRIQINCNYHDENGKVEITDFLIEDHGDGQLKNGTKEAL